MTEQQKEFLTTLTQLADYWANIQTERHLPAKETHEGLIHSILVYIDGMTTAGNGYTIINNETEQTINDGDTMLHELLQEI